jgi:hypothetical protein
MTQRLRRRDIAGPQREVSCVGVVRRDAGITSLRRSVQRRVIDSFSSCVVLEPHPGESGDLAAVAAQEDARYRATFVVTRSGPHHAARKRGGRRVSSSPRCSTSSYTGPSWR